MKSSALHLEHIQDTPVAVAQQDLTSCSKTKHFKKGNQGANIFPYLIHEYER